MHHRKMAIFLAALCSSALSVSAALAFESGAGSYIFNDNRTNQPHQIKVWYYMPPGFATDRDVVFVMHGVLRNGDVYRDNWIDLAEQGRFLVLAPQFSEDEYPTPRHYQQGNILAEDGTLNESEKWSVNIIDQIFQEVVDSLHLQAKDYVIFGHSGGSQFVHRMMLLYPEARVRLAIAANAGFYTMPDTTIPYPYGLKNTPTDNTKLKDVLKKPIVVMLGEDDNDAQHRFLNREPEAMAQGRHRLERGHAFFETAKRRAAELDVRFCWQLVTVPGVGHKNAKMAIAAAKLLD